MNENGQRLANARSTDDAFIALLTLEHPSFDAPARIARNTEDVVSRGLKFQALSFEIVWPDSVAHAFQLRVDIIDTDIRNRVRAASGPIRATVEAVLSDAPDVVVEGPHGDLILRDVHWDDLTLTGSLARDDALQQMLPGDSYDPIQFAGIF
jgi:hypothetical protein